MTDASNNSDVDWTRIIRQFGRLVLAYTIHKVSDPAHAEEIVQDVFVSAFENWKSLERPDAIASWLLGIARNKIRDFYRRNNVGDRAYVKLLQLPASNRISVQQNVLREELVATITGTIARLNSRHRNVLWLRLVEELPFPEIAKQLHLKESTVRMRFHRGIAVLRGQLVRAGISVEDAYFDHAN